jgi:hypothetical protein
MNRLSLSYLLGLLMAGSMGLTLLADETSWETVNGVTYRVTRRVVKRPVARTSVEPRTQTVQATEFVTEMRETARVVWVPVTHYVNVPKWHNWWNPFTEAYLAYEPRPVTRWELRTQMVREPVSRKQQVPQERIVQLPVRTLGFAEETVEERIAVNTIPGTTASPVPPTRFVEQPSAINRDFPRLSQPATSLELRR